MAGSSPVFLVTGAGGQVGNALLKTLAPLGRVVATDRSAVDGAPACHTLDLTDERAVADLVAAVKPTAVINPAAYTAVDKAESEPELARQINAVAAGHLAAAAAKAGAAFVHYSTDYVFDGSGTAPRDESAPPEPLGVYGRTKLEGETAVLKAHPGAVVLRTSWVFSAHGHNFVKTMLRFGAEREQLKVVADQIGAPTSAAFLADHTARVLRQGGASGWRGLGGLYHLCCAGETSWHGFAEEIFRQARAAGMELKVKEVVPLRTEEWPTPTARPQNSRLACGKFCRVFAAKLISWQEALAPVIRDLM